MLGLGEDVGEVATHNMRTRKDGKYLVIMTELLPKAYKLATKLLSHRPLGEIVYPKHNNKIHTTHNTHTRILT